MMTFKQLEALYWIAQLGGFGAAADKLHATQSAVSKRVRELELAFDMELFDRSQRGARLTEKGEEMFAIAKRLLEQRDTAIDQLSKPEVVERRVRIGVTEITALTWLPKLVELIEAHYPKVTIEPDVDVSMSLRDKLLADELDLIFAADAFPETKLQTKPVGRIQSTWMCKPGLLDPNKTFRLHELATHRLILQAGRSTAGLLHTNWMKSLGVQPARAVIVNNFLAMIGLTASGLGVGFLPEQCMSGMVANGTLAIVKCTPAAPPVTYVAMYKGEHRSTLISSIVMLAQECCDFSQIFRLDRV